MHLNLVEMQYSNEQDLQPSTDQVVDRKMCSNPRHDVVLKSSDYKKSKNRPGSKKLMQKGVYVALLI